MRSETGEPMEPTVFREQMINFLEAAVVLLVLINAFSAAAAVYALALAQRLTRPGARAAAHGLPIPLPRWLRASGLTR
jgi:hypothetical protein